MLFDIHETHWGDQKGRVTHQKYFANQQEADAYCSQLAEENECYMYFAFPAELQNITITPELEAMAARIRMD